MMPSSIRNTSTAAFVAAVAFFSVIPAPSAHAQRMSLAERVDRLEQQQNTAQGSVDLVNRINDLQSQVQALQGQNEELKHQIDLLKQQNKDVQADFDSRIARLEGRAPAAGPNNSASTGTQLQDMQLGTPGPANAPPTRDAPPPARDVPPPANVPPSNAPPANPADEKAAYDQAFGALKDGRYAESARAFQSFISQYPTSELTPNAYYWLGESYYVTQNYPVSLDTFNKLLGQYPNSQKAPAALLKVGYCQYELRQWDSAEATLNQVVQKYPGTQEANLAQGRLRALRLERK
jgi:tol-pal system protein YbgF